MALLHSAASATASSPNAPSAPPPSASSTPRAVWSVKTEAPHSPSAWTATKDTVTPSSVHQNMRGREVARGR